MYVVDNICIRSALLHHSYKINNNYCHYNQRILVITGQNPKEMIFYSQT